MENFDRFLLSQPLLDVPITGEACQTYGGGQGWAWAVTDNCDVTLDGNPENYIDFFHYAIGRITSDLVNAQRHYDKASATATIVADGYYNKTPVRIKAVIRGSGGLYGNGLTVLTVTTLSGATLRELKLNAVYTRLSFG